MISYLIVIFIPIIIAQLQKKRIDNYIKKEYAQLKLWYEPQNFDRLIQGTQSAIITNYLLLNKVHASIFCGDFAEAERTMGQIKIRLYMLYLFSLKRLCSFFFYAFQSKKPETMKAYRNVCAELGTKQKALRCLVDGIFSFMEGEFDKSTNEFYKFIQQSKPDDFYLPCVYYYLAIIAQGQGRIADQLKYYTLLQQTDSHTIFYKWSLAWGNIK